MKCDEILARAAEFDGDPDVARHLVACQPCRESVDAARDGLDGLVGFEQQAEAGREVPAADALTAWRMARSRHRPRRRIASRLAKAAVVLLAASGALALAGVELRPRAEPAPPLTRADVQAVVDAGLARLGSRLDARDVARATEVRDVADWLDERRRGDVEALVAELVSLRREVAGLRLSQSSLAGSAMPALPDPR